MTAEPVLTNMTKASEAIVEHDFRVGEAMIGE
jgi:hypothetical protein